ncbi:C4-dicarboxylate transporter DcuC [Laribacter hongkongensis]|uniref:C4-dicarboxylate transporter DcuC n=1 Tax=Laribacter hongkongensis TaxID=168471 RepID=UPI001EFEBD79|nr:C4-dicarboxylate transporter DcuC [Laribacter hongkongensis]MCG9056046.1 C4-dicarboxylate transporter DcuC [Laribacter hongkongensis]
MLELLIGFAVTAVFGRYIFKGHSPTGVLMVGGVLLLAVAAWLGQPVLPDKVEATGLVLTDIVEFIKRLLSNRSADLGLMIMVLCGFAAYMTHIGANDMVVKLAARPLEVIKSPYVLMVAAYFVACVMSLAVSSATGLGVLLMATLFPLMVDMGISRGAAAAFVLRRLPSTAPAVQQLRALRDLAHPGTGRKPAGENGCNDTGFGSLVGTGPAAAVPVTPAGSVPDRSGSRSGAAD